MRDHETGATRTLHNEDGLRPSSAVYPATPDPAHQRKFAAFYREHFGFVWSSLRRFGVPDSELDDAAHDVFVVVHRRHGDLPPDFAPRAWLFGVVRRIASNHRRSVGRHRRRLRAYASASATASSPEREHQRAEAADLLQRFLARLGEHQRDVFVLCELQQMTANEVAAALDINPNTASARLKAARREFERFAGKLRGELLGRARSDDRPPPGAAKRVWAMIGLRLAAPAPLVTASTGVAYWLKAASVSMLLASGSLAAVAVLAPAPAPALASAPGSDDPAPPRPPTSTSIAATTSNAPEPQSSPPVAEPPPVRTPPVRPRTKRVSTVVSSSDTVPLDDLSAQNDLLARARRALEADRPREVIDAASAYRERFPQGPFIGEFALLEVRGLCSLGDSDRARSRADALAERFPGSAHASAAAKICADSITKPDHRGDE